MNRPRNSSWDQRAFLLPGEIVIAAVRNQREDPWAIGKRRPVILIAESDGSAGWCVAGLTTRATYRDGRPRVPLTDLTGTTLRQPSFFWSDHLTYIDTADVHGHAGFASPLLQSQLLEVLGLPTDERAFLASWLNTRGHTIEPGGRA